MSQSHKPYAFDRVFGADGTVLRDGDSIREYLTREEAAAEASAAAGAARESEEVRAAQEAADALKTIGARLQVILSRMEAESTAMREDAARLATAIATRIAGESLSNYGADTISQCVAEALQDLRSEPRIAVRVAPQLADAVAENLQDVGERIGFEGAIIVRADDEVASGDCVLEWRSGVIERTAADVQSRINDVVESWLARPTEPTQNQTDSHQTGRAGDAAA